MFVGNRKTVPLGAVFFYAIPFEEGFKLPDLAGISLFFEGKWLISHPRFKPTGYILCHFHFSNN
jgi:hypothetical protein